MNWQSLFTSFDGRIGRKQFWIGVVVLMVASIVVYFIVGPIFGVSMFAGMNAVSADGNVDVEALQATITRANWFSLIMFALFLWPGAALTIKRRHDRGSTGIEVWVIYGLQGLSALVAALGIGMTLTDMGGGVMLPMPGIISTVIGAVAGIGSLYLLIVCGFLKGTDGENAYGPDPLAG
jgi:uncharacterized membrane protein YhaH (DUF805 family)